jgi:hypothetical protein
MSLFDRILAEAGIERGVERLYVFDMDSTLIEEPRPEKVDYTAITGKPWPERWWATAATLKKPLPIPVKPEVRAAFMQAKRDSRGKVVVMTGRVATPEMQTTVVDLLNRLGFGPLRLGDNLFLKRLNEHGTANWKKKMLTGFTKRFPDLKEIHIWDDRCDHVRDFEQHIKSLGLVAVPICVTAKELVGVAEDRWTSKSDRGIMDPGEHKEDTMSLYDRVVLQEYGAATRFEKGPAYHNTDNSFSGRRGKTSPGFFIDPPSFRYANIHSRSQAAGAMKQAYDRADVPGFGPKGEKTVKLATKLHARFGKGKHGFCPSALAVDGKCEKPTSLAVAFGGEAHGKGGKEVDPDYRWPCSVQHPGPCAGLQKKGKK